METCPSTYGTFRGEYSLIEGTCDPDFQPPPFTMERDDPNSTIAAPQDSTVTTEFVKRSCELDIKQTILNSDNNQTLASYAGKLLVESATELRGTIERLEYASDGFTLRCSSSYEAVYTRERVQPHAGAGD